MRNFLIGIVAVLAGHAVVLAAARFLEGADPIISFTPIAFLLLGAIQLIYVLPLLGYGLWRRRALAGGVGLAAALTVAFSLLGFFDGSALG